MKKQITEQPLSKHDLDFQPMSCFQEQKNDSIYSLLGANIIITLFTIMGFLYINYNISMYSIVDFISLISYLAGFGFGIKAALQVKIYNENKEHISLAGPFTMALISSLLIALPSFLSVSHGSCWI